MREYMRTIVNALKAWVRGMLDWKQLKNKPFYEEEIPVSEICIPSTTLTCETMDGAACIASINTTYQMIGGTTYAVTVNGEEYALVAYEIEGIMFLGDIAGYVALVNDCTKEEALVNVQRMLPEYVDPGVSFLFLQADFTAFCSFDVTVTDYTIELWLNGSRTIFQKLDEKFLPDDLVRSSAQAMSESQKAQVRKNIDAVSPDDVYNRENTDTLLNTKQPVGDYALNDDVAVVRERYFTKESYNWNGTENASAVIAASYFGTSFRFSKISDQLYDIEELKKSTVRWGAVGSTTTNAEVAVMADNDVSYISEDNESVIMTSNALVAKTVGDFTLKPTIGNYSAITITVPESGLYLPATPSSGGYVKYAYMARGRNYAASKYPEFVLDSMTEGSASRFKFHVDDTGTPSATNIGTGETVRMATETYVDDAVKSISDLITITANDDGTYTTDTPYADIVAAIEAGKNIIARREIVSGSGVTTREYQLAYDYAEDTASTQAVSFVYNFPASASELRAEVISIYDMEHDTTPSAEVAVKSYKYSHAEMGGATETEAGVAGLVPAPAAGHGNRALMATGEFAPVVPAPATAAVGDIMRVAAVDDSGMPTAWEVCGRTWELLCDITTEEDVQRMSYVFADKPQEDIIVSIETLAAEANVSYTPCKIGTRADGNLTFSIFPFYINPIPTTTENTSTCMVSVRETDEGKVLAKADTSCIYARYGTSYVNPKENRNSTGWIEWFDGYGNTLHNRITAFGAHTYGTFVAGTRMRIWGVKQQ